MTEEKKTSSVSLIKLVNTPNMMFALFIIAVNSLQIPIARQYRIDIHEPGIEVAAV